MVPSVGGAAQPPFQFPSRPLSRASHTEGWARAPASEGEPASPHRSLASRRPASRRPASRRPTNRRKDVAAVDGAADAVAADATRPRPPSAASAASLRRARASTSSDAIVFARHGPHSVRLGGTLGRTTTSPQPRCAASTASRPTAHRIACPEQHTSSAPAKWSSVRGPCAAVAVAAPAACCCCCCCCCCCPV